MEGTGRAPGSLVACDGVTGSSSSFRTLCLPLIQEIRRMNGLDHGITLTNRGNSCFLHYYGN